MKALMAVAGALWMATLSAAETAQAAPPQPVIHMPQHPATPGSSSAPDAPPNPSWRPGRGGCLADGSGYFRARIGGALHMDVNWKGTQLECSGEARPDRSGLRVAFAGPGPGGKLMRLVFGVGAAREGSPGRELPTNLTVLLEGGRVFATRGDDKCTMDQLTQRPLPGERGVRVWRIEGRGFCVAPANALAGTGRILVTRFDFAGRIEFSGRS
jgi:hypothetical protein